jgi:hypothetical protein
MFHDLMVQYLSIASSGEAVCFSQHLLVVHHFWILFEKNSLLDNSHNIGKQFIETCPLFGSKTCLDLVQDWSLRSVDAVKLCLRTLHPRKAGKPL